MYWENTRYVLVASVKFPSFCLQQEYKRVIDTDLTSIPHGSVELKWKQTHLTQF